MSRQLEPARRGAWLTHRMLTAVIVVVSIGQMAAQAPTVPLGSGRPDTAGVTRVSLRDDARTAVVKVKFEAGAKGPPHHHPYYVLLIPITIGTVDFAVSGRQVMVFTPGSAQFIPSGEIHLAGERWPGSSSSPSPSSE